MARAQRGLARNTVAELDLEGIVREEFLQNAACDSDQIEISGAPVLLRQKPAEMMCLAIHELVTNSVKFGALADRKGVVRVSWRVEAAPGGDRLLFDWSETGVALLDASPKRAGFGRDLIEHGLPYELGGETWFTLAPGGVQCHIEARL